MVWQSKFKKVLPHPCEVPTSKNATLRLEAIVSKVVYASLLADEKLATGCTVLDVQVMYPLTRRCGLKHRCHFYVSIGLSDAFTIEEEGKNVSRAMKKLVNASACEIFWNGSRWVAAVTIKP